MWLCSHHWKSLRHRQSRSHRPSVLSSGRRSEMCLTADAGAQILAYPYRVLLIIILWIYRTMFCRCIGNIGSSEHRAAGYVLKLGIAFDSVSVSSGLSLMLRHLFKAQAVLSEHRQSFQSTGSLFRASAGRGCNDISCFISLPFVFVGFCSTKNLNSARNIPYVI